MKIYCVVDVNQEYGDHALIAVFSTPEKADAYIDKVGGRMVGPPAQTGDYSHNSGLMVDILELDAE